VEDPLVENAQEVGECLELGLAAPAAHHLAHELAHRRPLEHGHLLQHEQAVVHALHVPREVRAEELRASGRCVRPAQ
jgi:hypothetical protein